MAKRKILAVDLWKKIFSDKEILKLFNEYKKEGQSKHSVFPRKFDKEVKRGLRNEVFTVVEQESKKWIEDTLTKNPKAFADKEWMQKYHKWRQFFDFIIEKCIMDF